MKYKTWEQAVNEREKINIERKKLQEKELKEKYPNADDRFTNKEELEYSLENDLVNVKVLNNNTKLLDEKKADITSLNNVARESTPMAIENAVKNISNDVSQNLQGVAKERSEYSIEDRVKNLEDNIPKYYYDLHYNYIGKQVSSVPLNNEILLSEATGQGELVHCFLGFSGTGTDNNDRPAYKFKIVIDGEVKLFHTVYLMGKVNYPKAGFFSYTNISHYEADYTRDYQNRYRYYPYSYLPIIRKNGSSYETGMGVVVYPRNYIMHPLSSKEKKLYVNGELIFTQGTIEMKPIKYKNKVQVYLTLLDRLDQLTEINLSMYYKPNN